MAGQNHWERQRREIDSCNVFYSAFYGTNGGQSLKDLGFNRPLRFPSIPVRRDDDAEPDFAIYNGSTLFLAEIKSGKNLSNRHKRQMERCTSVTIEDGENFLKDAQVRKYGLDPNNLEEVESGIVYMEDRYTDHIDVKHNQNRLSEIEQLCPILTQSRGGTLELVRGQFGDASLNSFLTKGVSLPDIPPQAIFLNEAIEKECLAVSICYDHVMRDLKNGRVVLDEGRVEDLYPIRAIDYRDIADVLRFLESLGACRRENGEYVFEQGHQRNIFKVKDAVAEKRVDEYLDNPDEDQSTIHDWDGSDE